MNANHAEPNAENAELSPLQKLNGLIFDLGDTIPEGVYLEMMNQTKKIYDEMKEKIKIYTVPQRTISQRINDIINKEDKTYFLRRIKKDINNEGESILKIYGNDNLLIQARDLKIGSILRLHAFYCDYKFMIIKKINEKSFKYDLVKITNGADTIGISRDRILKIKEGEYLEDLLNKAVVIIVPVS